MKNIILCSFTTLLFSFFSNLFAQSSSFCGVVIVLQDQDNAKYNSQLTSTKRCYNHDAAGNLIGTKACVTATASSSYSLDENTTQQGPLDLGESLKAYPNPTSGIFYLAQEEKSTNAINKVQVVSINSAVIITIPVSTNSKLTTIDLSGQSPGIYIVNILFANGKNKSIKVIRI
jgi:hypothetical protein